MSGNPSAKPATTEICFSDDETMQRRLLRKRQLEDSEIYNAPETMAVKRRAVKEAAKKTPVPKKIPNLTFDDQIEPSEAPEQEQQQGEEQDEKPIIAGESGSNAAQSGGEIKGDVIVLVPRVRQRDATMVDGMAEDQKEAVPEVKDKTDGDQMEVEEETTNQKAEGQAGAQSVKPPRKVQPVLPKVTLDPRKWAQKSNQGARRSRHRLRRLLKEEETLLSSQLQVV